MYDLLIDIPAVNVIFIKINGDENGLKQNYFVFLLNQTRSGHHMNNYTLYINSRVQLRLVVVWSHPVLFIVC